MFNWLKKTISRYSVENPSVPLTVENLDAYREHLNNSPVRVNATTALSNPAVKAATRLIANHVANMPVCPYRRKADDGREKAREHPAYKLIVKRAHRLYSSWQFKHTIQIHAIIHGNGYAWIERDQYAEPISLWILDPETTHYNDGVYSTAINGVQQYFAPEDMLHIRNMSGDGLTGYITYVLHRESIREGLNHIRYSAHYFGKNCKPPIVVIAPPGVNDLEKLKAFKNNLTNWYFGGADRGEPGVLPGATDFRELSGNVQQSEVVELKKADLIAIANIIGVPASKIGSEQNVSYASLLQDNQSLLVDHLNAWLCQWENELEKLLTQKQVDTDTHYFEFERKSILQMTPSEEDTMLTNQLNNGGISWEEYRKIKNLPAEKPEDEEWRLPNSVVVQGKEPLPSEPQEQEPPLPDSEPLSKQLTRGIVSRLLTRVERSVESGKSDLNAHRDVFLSELSPIENSEEWVARFIQRTQEELDAVLPEQRAEVISRISADTLVEEIYNGN